MSVSSRKSFAAICGVVAWLAILCSPVAVATSPEAVLAGKELFEREWPARNPSIGNDGLGPLFNAKSCVACHHQGGAGGGGDTRFNAIAIGIESVHSNRPQTSSLVLKSFLEALYPGFGSGGATMTTTPIPHHSVAPLFASARNAVLKRVLTQPSAEGGPADVESLRTANQIPIVFTKKIGRNQLTAQARLFQRNTTSLFGAGLIDSIPPNELVRQAKIQERNREISGRVSVLADGSAGRFGWRANASRLAHFVDRACANELGLETKRRRQAPDPTQPRYRNPAADINDEQIGLMTAFISNLPAPQELAPRDDQHRAELARGRKLFQSIGCAACHVPQLGTVKGIYSDLLLHDMGPKLYDYDAAEPYVVKVTPVYDRGRIVPETAANTPTAYYGAAQPLPPRYMGPSFVTPRGNQKTKDYKTISVGREYGRKTLAVLGPRASLTAEVREEIGFDRKLKPSMTTQEWRTPPLWGLRDSAPYMHDGRAETVLEAIMLHQGEAERTRDRFLAAPIADRQAMLALLQTFVAPPHASPAEL